MPTSPIAFPRVQPDEPSRLTQPAFPGNCVTDPVAETAAKAAIANMAFTP
jgi:hypothetical protein